MSAILTGLGERALTFLLSTGNHSFHTFFQVSCIYFIPAHANSPQSSLINNIRQFCSGGTSRSTSHHINIHLFMLYPPQVYIQNGFSSFQIWKFHLYSAVESSGTQQRFVQAVGAIGCSQYDNAFAAVESVHLGQ